MTGGDEDEPFPYGRYFCLSAVLIVNCISISFIFPFVGFMVIDLGLVQVMQPGLAAP